MAILKKPYELSVWIEKLNSDGIKDETKSIIIGSDNMSYPGRATNVILKRELKGTNILTFEMVDRYFDSLNGDYVRNEFIDDLFPERKVKLFYQNQWFEFFIKKISEKKVFKSYIKTYTCTDAFIEELSKNGYGLTFNEELYNNVNEIGDFTNEVLENSLWYYSPEYNWGDFAEYTKERLYKIPISQFSSNIVGYKFNFNLSKNQKENFNLKSIKNIYTKEEREVKISDDIAKETFWDQQNLFNPNGEIDNPLKVRYINDIETDGFIYVPYTALNFCYGFEYSPDEKIKYDRLASETALKVDDKLVISPPSVNPNTVIPFIAIPKNATFNVDEEGVILNDDYYYFMTLRQWNELISNNIWYFFEDTRIVEAEQLGEKNLKNASISHTFKYLYYADNKKVLDTYKESYGNKVVYYNDYLRDDEDNELLGKKYVISDRTEINISKEIDQYVIVYNNSPDEYVAKDENLYSSEKWNYQSGDNKYRVCSKISTRQIIPQLARNLIQNGVNIQSNNGWENMSYLDTNTELITNGKIELRTITEDNNDNIKGSVLYYNPPHKELAYIWEGEIKEEKQIYYQIKDEFYMGDSKNGIWAFKFVAKKGDTLYNFIKQNFQKKSIKNNGATHYLIQSIYGNNDNEIRWIIDNEEKNIPLNKNDFCILNFGIVGQKKKIEKDKIYCIGIEILIDAIQNEDTFSILIGDGGIVSNGVYSFTNKVIEITKEQIFGEQFLGNDSEDFNWENLSDPTYTIKNNNFKKSFLLFRSPDTIENPYFAIYCKNKYLIKTAYLFEAYSKGQDSFPIENAPHYKYSGRDLFGVEQPQEHINEGWNYTIETDNNYKYSYSFYFNEEEIRNRIIFEDMIMLGATYEYQQYFIQRLKAVSKSGEIEYFDTCGEKEFISTKNENFNSLPLDATKYTEDDYTIETNYINLNKCKYYNSQASSEECDCGFNSALNPTSICYYQRFGYCPYRFQTEKHCRRVRTLKISKSNRFNIVQEISKVFQIYPQFYIDHQTTGQITKNNNNNYKKIIFYITEKGMENKIGFRYEKNLKDISRNFDSEKIVSKLYVQDVDSELSKTGLCSIKTAEDNITKDSFIIDFSYYIKKGLLDKDQVERDLYGMQDSNKIINTIPQGFLRQLGYYNEQYDKITNQIINLQNSSYTELEANLNVNLEGIITSQEQLIKIKKQMENFVSIEERESQAYLNYKTKKEEQEAILLQIISNTFYTNGMPETDSNYYNEKYGIKEWNPLIDFSNPIIWFDYYIKDYNQMKKTWVDEHIYTQGLLGQFNKEYNQIQEWKKERAVYLKLINKISENFYKKYEPYLKEGTWQDSTYLTDNSYYFGALQVSAQGAIPKVSYDISVISLDVFEKYQDIYNFQLGDISYIEDIGMFGINKKTGLPNRLKILISEITYNLDQPFKDSIKVQNYTTKFEDLFQQITSSVQSLQYNENIYKRSSNFTSLQNIKEDSLQGALDSNNLTLLNTAEENIKIDKEGTLGSDLNNHASKYKQNGQGIYFSNDGGQHWNMGIGASGINADYIKVGTLDASKIKIVDGNYLYFSWDKDGIVSYRDPFGVNTTETNKLDFVSFNKFGLSLVENNYIRLRAGYIFNGDENGQINTENEIGDELGFYLYNSSGKEVFSAGTSNDNINKNVDTARIKLLGEMFISNLEKFSSVNYSYIYKDKSKKESECVAYNQTGEEEEFMYTGQDLWIKSDRIKLIKNNKIISTNEYYIMEIQGQEEIKMYATSLPPSTIFTEGTRYQIIPIDKNAYTCVLLKSIESNEQLKIETKYSNLIENSSIKYFIDNILQSKTLYETDNDIYYTSMTEEIKEKEGEESAAILLNNRQNFKDEEEQTEKQRLICISKKETSEIKNIITVLKNGSLYIGGKIVDKNGNSINEDSLSKLPDLIQINDAYIKMEPTTDKLIIDIGNIDFYRNGKDINFLDFLGGKNAN